MRKLNRDQVIALLKEKQGDRTAVELAADLGITPQYLSDVYLGKREPGVSILEKLGLYREWAYYRDTKREEVSQ